MERHNNSGKVDSETKDDQNDRERPQAAHGHHRIPEKDLCVAQERKRCKHRKKWMTCEGVQKLVICGWHETPLYNTSA